jgi:prevent-host-death family protein
MEWKLADAKNRFSELVSLALSEGPQLVVRRDDTVVVVSKRHYEQLAGKRRSFKQFLMEGPDLEGLDLKRDRSRMRDARL